MKTVSGTIISTKPVNLSKAAKILSNFVTSDNGASQSVSAYLRRASTAFNELVYFKKHHKLKKHRTKEKASVKSEINPRNSEGEVRVLENGRVNRKFDQDPVDIDEKGSGKVENESRKKEKKKKKIEGSLGSEKNDEFDDKLEEDNVTVNEKSEEKKKKKKRKNAEVDGGEIGNSVGSERKKKRRRAEADD